MPAARAPRTLSRVLCCFWLCCLLPLRTLAYETRREQPLPISALHGLPLQFEQNQGQAEKETRFLARGAGYMLLLDQDGLRLDLRHRRRIFMNLVGAQTASIAGREPSSTKTNYYLGSNPADWHLDVPTYRSVTYTGVYPGIDLTYHGSGQQLEYDFVVAPQADPSQVKMRFAGLHPTPLGEDLGFEGLDSLRVKALKAYQWMDGKKERVEASWQVHDGEASIRVGAYDKQRALIIDPVFFYGTYIGGAGIDAAVSVVAAPQPGYYYVALSTTSASLTQPGSASAATMKNVAMIVGIDTTASPGPPSPLPPFNSNPPAVYPSLLVNSVTYVGGATGDIFPTDMVGDQSGNLYITGTTTNGGAFVPPPNQACSACTGFVAQFATSIDTGTTPAKATVTPKYAFGLPATPYAIAVDKSGDVYLTGTASATSGTPMLTIPSGDKTFQNTAAAAIGTGANTHAFLLELDPTGATLFCSLIGGSGLDQGNALAVSGDTVFVAGQTTSVDFPKTANAFQPNIGGGQDGFVLAASKLSTSPSLTFSTYLGSTGTDTVASIAVTPAGDPVVTGSTDSVQFPTQPNPSFIKLRWPIMDNTDNEGNETTQLPGSVPTVSHLPTAPLPGLRDAFVSSLSADGAHLLFTDFLGGDDSGGITIGNALAVDGVGVIYVVGSSTGVKGQFLPGDAIGDSDPDFTQNPPYVLVPTGTYPNILFAEIDPTGSYLLEATLAGSFGADRASGLAISNPLAASGAVSIVGNTTASPNSVLGTSDPELFVDAGASIVDMVAPPPPSPAKSAPANTTGFLVQEALAGFCNMKLTAQAGTLLTFSGPCASGTQSGFLYASPASSSSSGKPFSAPIAVTPSGAFLTALVTVDVSSLGSGNASFIFAFLPLGAIGGVAGCTNEGTSLMGCGIVTAGGGAETLFNVTSGALTVSLECGDNCNYNGTPNTVMVGQPVALSATVTNGIPDTVTWTSSQGVFTGNNPASSIMFTPGGNGGPVVVQATPVANPSVLPTSITLNTKGGSTTTGGSLTILSKTSMMVAGTSFQFTANQQPVTWTATSGTIDPNTGEFTAPNPPPGKTLVTITATQTNPSSTATTQVTIFPQPLLVVPANTTLPAGGSVSIPISLTAGTGIQGEALLFTCSPNSLPTGVSCSFTPNPVTNNGGAQLTLKLSSATVGELLPLKPLSWGGSVVVFTGAVLWSRRRMRWTRSNPTYLAAVALAFLFGLTACGTGGSFSGTSQQGHLSGNYTISITVMGNTQGAADLNQTVATANLAVKLQ